MVDQPTARHRCFEGSRLVRTRKSVPDGRHCCAVLGRRTGCVARVRFAKSAGSHGGREKRPLVRFIRSTSFYREFIEYSFTAWLAS